MTDNILELTESTFDAEVVDRPGVVLVDFWAEWCGPCKMLAPILADVADEYGGQARIAKMNADDNKLIAGRLAVRGLPTMVLFVDGIEKGRLVGNVTKTRLCAFIDQHTEA